MKPLMSNAWDVARGKGVWFDLVRFLMFGGANTLLTFAIYQILVTYISPQKSYLVSWVCGVAYVLILYPNKVFLGAHRSLVKSGMTVACYVCVYLFSSTCLMWLISVGIHERIGVVVVSALSICLNFIGMLLIFRLFMPRRSEEE